MGRLLAAEARTDRTVAEVSYVKAVKAEGVAVVGAGFFPE